MNIHQIIAEGLTTELQPPPGYTLHAQHHNQQWQVNIETTITLQAEDENEQHKSMNKWVRTIATITLEPNHITWNQKTSTNYDYEDPRLIDQLQQQLNNLAQHPELRHNVHDLNDLIITALGTQTPP